MHWAQSVEPGLRVVVCGGAAIILWGGNRVTMDLDTALDFTSCQRKMTANTLKDLARQSDKFEVGLQIIFKGAESDPNPIQIDFVDAQLMYAPWDVEFMVTTLPNYPGIEILTVPTLLVQKVLTVLQRSFPDQEKLGKKRLTDFSDFQFLLRKCILDDLLITPPIAKSFPSDPQAILKDFLTLGRDMEALDNKDISMWDDLVVRSGLDSWKMK